MRDVESFKRVEDRVVGFTRPHQLHRLYRAVLEQEQRGDCLEIGCWEGRTAIAIALALQERGHDETLYCVDPWTIEHGAEYEVDLRKGVVDMRPIFEENCVSFGVRELVDIVQMTSQQAREAGAVGPVRFAFIDGDHRFEAVMSDLEWCWELMCDVYGRGTANQPQPGGIVVVDDMIPVPQWGVRAAVEAFRESVGEDAVPILWKDIDPWAASPPGPGELGEDRSNMVAFQLKPHGCTHSA